MTIITVAKYIEGKRFGIIDTVSAIEPEVAIFTSQDIYIWYAMCI